MSLKGKKVFVTGHTGFKGTYLTKALLMEGADVFGYALSAKDTDLYNRTNLKKEIKEVIADVRDLETLKRFFNEVNPDYVIHMAAQPLVLDSYRDPHYTYEVNVMGTVNILECVRQSETVTSFLNVTTDKVYENNELDHAFTEDEKLDGKDPYSNSKSCSDIITHSYKHSFLQEKSVSTVRAGNVIGGGDTCDNRIIPDCVRAMLNKEDIIIRNPNSVRPYQYVVEPILAYMKIIDMQNENRNLEGSYNIGPNKNNCVKTEDLVKMFCTSWGDNAKYIVKNNPDAPKEAGLLMLNNKKIFDTFGIKPILDSKEMIERTVNVYKNIYVDKLNDVDKILEEEIKYVKGRS